MLATVLRHVSKGVRVGGGGAKNCLGTAIAPLEPCTGCLCVKHGQKHRGHRCGHHPRIWHDRMATHGHSHKTSMIGDFRPPSKHSRIQ